MNTSQKDIDVSVVIPLLNEEESLPELSEWIKSALESNYSFEIIFVDDGSDDKSWQVITQLNQRDPRVRGLRLRRNYGKSTALSAGFKRARGRFVATLDADLQDDPRELPEMIAMVEQEYDLVSGWKKKRNDPISKTVPSRFFNAVTRWVTGIKLNDFNCGLKVYRREVIEHIDLYGEMHRYIPALAAREGFSKIGEKSVQHHARKYGESKFGLNRFIRGFLDLVTLKVLQTYVQRPMHLFGAAGTLFFLVGMGITGYLVFMRIFFEMYLSDRPLLIIGVLFILLGIQIFSIGLFGEMMNKQNNNRYKANIREEL